MHVIEFEGHAVELDDFIYRISDSLLVIEVNEIDLKFFSLEVLVHVPQTDVFEGKDGVRGQGFLFFFC